MMRPTIRARLLFLLLLVSVVFAVALAWLTYAQHRAADLLLRESGRERAEVFDRVVGVRSATLQAYAVDYTFWDDMVRFVDTADPEWAEQNLDSSLETYQADALWVFRSDGRLVYFANASPDLDLRSLALPAGVILRALQDRLLYYFVASPLGPVEMRAATIHPTRDVRRRTPPRGVFFVARVWTPRYVDELSALTDTRILLHAPGRGPAPTPLRPPGAIVFAKSLPGWDGAPVAHLEVRSESVVIPPLDRLAQRTFVLFASSAAVALIALGLFLVSAVVQPMNLLTRSLAEGNPELLDRLSRSGTEFGLFARLVRDFFRQKASLVEEVAERTRAQEEVRALNAGLEHRVAERTAELEAANRAKAEFLSRVSHELRTPLNAILGFGQLLEMDIQATPEQKESVEHILRSGRHLLQLIDEVLDLSRIDTGRLELSPEAVDLDEIVREALAAAGGFAAERRVTLDYVPVGGRHAWADRARLRQAIVNILLNGVKYNRPDGFVHVRLEEGSAGLHRITVADTGRGIPREQMSHLFMPFEQLRSGQDEGPETGVGLALSRRLIELMGGTLGGESTVGVGSRFWIDIPAADEEGQGAAARLRADPSPAETGRVVLHVGDRLAPFDLVRRVIGRWPSCRLLGTARSEEGVALARRLHPALILLQPQLPDGTGLEVVQRIRQDPEIGATPVIVFGGESPHAEVERLRQAGARVYRTRPLDLREFIALLDGVLGAGAPSTNPTPPLPARTAGQG